MADFERLLFNTDIPYHEPQSGELLIAQPFLDDEPFRHSVVQLIDREREGSFTGIVLNKPTPSTLSEVIDVDLQVDDPTVYLGGPVGLNRLTFLHDLGTYISGSFPIGNGLYAGGKLADVVDYINSEKEYEKHIRFFVGYSGWHAQQLQQEIEDNSWAVLPSPPTTTIFSDGVDSYWHRFVRLLGDDYKSWLYHPMNPEMN